MRIETERMILRPVLMTDVQDIYQNSKEAEVGLNAGWKPHESLEETEKIVQELFVGQKYILAMELKETGRVLGTLGIIEDPKRMNPKARMLGYSLGKAYWGKGYMTEAARSVCAYGFEALGLDLISAYCYPDNRRSKRVLEKLGFTYEGCLKLCEALYNGEVRDNECFILLPTGLRKV